MSIFKNFFDSSGTPVPPENGKIPPEEDAVLEKVAKKVIEWEDGGSGDSVFGIDEAVELYRGSGDGVF